MYEKQKVWLWVDPTSECNLSCAVCYTKVSHGDQRMSAADFGRILDNFRAHPTLEVQVLHLNWRGEPLLNPEFPGLLREIRDRRLDVPVHWHTNGTVLSEDLAHDLLESAPPHSFMYVSIDGGNEQSHDRNRGKGTFRQACSGLRTLLQARGTRTQPGIGLYQLDFGVPFAEFDPEFRDLCFRADDWVRVLPVALDGSERRPRDGKLFEIRRADENVPSGACFWAGNALCIAPNGDVSVCLVSHSASGIVGNLLRESAASVVHRARAFRHAIETRGRENIEHCKRCKKQCGDAHPEPIAPPVVTRAIGPLLEA